MVVVPIVTKPWWSNRLGPKMYAWTLADEELWIKTICCSFKKLMNLSITPMLTVPISLAFEGGSNKWWYRYNLKSLNFIYFIVFYSIFYHSRLFICQISNKTKRFQAEFSRDLEYLDMLNSIQFCTEAMEFFLYPLQNNLSSFHLGSIFSINILYLRLYRSSESRPNWITFRKSATRFRRNQRISFQFIHMDL